MPVHYSATGAKPAACGDASAKMFTASKTSVTCVPCKSTLGIGGAKPEPYIRTN